MRQVVSLSLPASTAKKIKILSSQRGFSSVSSYVKHLVELDEDIISEKELLNSIREAQDEYERGETVTAGSLLDLI